MSNVLPCVDPDQCLKKDGCQLFQICAKSGHHFLWKLPCSHHGCTAEILIPTHPKILQAFQYMGSKFHIQSKKILNQMQRFLHILEKFLFSQMIVSPKTSTLIFQLMLFDNIEPHVFNCCTVDNDTNYVQAMEIIHVVTMIKCHGQPTLSFLHMSKPSNMSLLTYPLSYLRQYDPLSNYHIIYCLTYFLHEKGPTNSIDLAFSHVDLYDASIQYTIASLLAVPLLQWSTALPSPLTQYSYPSFPARSLFILLNQYNLLSQLTLPHIFP